MRLAKRLFMALCAISAALLLNSQQPRAGGSCPRPYDMPTYIRPADDGVVFNSLLEAAGYGAGTNSGWVDLAAGNFCGGAEKELVLLKNRHSNFSILRGPAPFAVGSGDLDSNPVHPWRAVTAGNLDGDPFDEIVAVRHVTASNVPDVLVLKANGSTCDVTNVVASATIGNPGNSDWLDAATGDFDGSRTKQVVLLKAAHSNFVFLKLTGPHTLSTVRADDLVALSGWRALAAGDIDGDGVDELIAARQESDNRNATIMAFKWNGSAFRLLATSTFGNNGNSNWSSAAVGDFNGDGRKAIVLVKNNSSNFVVLDLPKGASQLRILATADLDTVAGQDWRGLAATDWLGGDLGAAELIAVRAAHDDYSTDLFVYGNGFHRIPRDTALAQTKAQFDQTEVTTLIHLGGMQISDFKSLLQLSHTNTFGWVMTQPVDYDDLVKFLEETKDFCVDGKQLRVWVTLLPPQVMKRDYCSLPVENSTTPWHELDFFTNRQHGVFASCNKIDAGRGVVCDYCKDYAGWASLIGRLAQDYPHLVALGIDDFTNWLPDFPGEVVAEVESRMRSQATWLNFVPTAYYSGIGGSRHPDLGRTVDNFLFYFRNEKAHACLGGVSCEASVANAPGEYNDIIALLPEGRKLQAGVYFSKHSTLGEPTVRYDFDLANLALNLRGIGGVTAYTTQLRKPGVVCSDVNTLNDKFCVILKAFGGKPQNVDHVDLTAAAKAPLAAGNPFGYVFDSQGVQNTVFRTGDGHVHELWRKGAANGHSDLTSLAGAPAAVGDPKAYVFPALGVQNVVYRGSDGHLHGLFWSTGAVGHDDLTVESHAPGPAGDPAAYVAPNYGLQNVVYRGTDGRLHGLYWSTGAVGHDDLTAASRAPLPAGNPAAYFMTTDATHHVIYRSGDGHLHELWWTTGAVGHNDLTAFSGAPAAAGDPAAYFAPTYGMQNVVYRGTDGHLHALYWTTGAVSHDDLTNASHAPAPASDAATYFNAADGTHHVIFTGADGHLHELWWTTGVVTHNDLTLLGGGSIVAGAPSAYMVAADGTQHAIHRSGDGHLHEFSWRK